MAARRVVPLVTGWQVATSSCYYALFAAAPFLRDAFGISRLLVGVVVTSLTLGYTLGLFPLGAVVDGFGEKRVLVAGAVAIAIGATAVVLVDRYPLLLVAALVVGAAYATAMPATNLAVVRHVAAGRKGFAMGVKQVGVTAGSGLAALLVVTLSPAVATWRAGFLAAAALALLAGVAVLVAYPASPGTGHLSLPDLRGFGANRAYLALVAAGLFLGAALFTTTGYATLYLTEAVHTGTALAGVGFALMAVVASAGRVGGGVVADRLTSSAGTQARAAATTMLAMAVVATGLLGLLAATTPTPAVGLLVLAGVGATVLGFTGLYHTCVASLVEEGRLGAGTAGAQTTLNAGALVAPPAFGWLVDHASYHAGWGLLAGCMAASVALLLVVRARTAAG